MCRKKRRGGGNRRKIVSVVGEKLQEARYFDAGVRVPQKLEVREICFKGR